jgi:HD-GYP domain-containing protein (c-di-GMP phosphodiesterase class II)
MLRMPLGQVEPGMKLAAPVPNPKQMEYDLLKAGFVLTEAMVERLSDLGVRTIWIDYPNLDFLDEMVNPRLTAEQQKIYSTMKEGFAGSQKRVVARIDFQEYRRTLTSMVEAIAGQGVDTLLIEPLVGEQADMFLHSSNVCYLSLMLGVKLGHYLVQQRNRLDPRHARDVMNLGLGALMHDVGKTELAEDLRAHEPLPGDELPDGWADHVRIGFDMIRGNVDPSASQVVLHHHQQWNGRGFPQLPSTGRPLSGERIHIFSRIVCIANWYDRRVQAAAREGLPPIVAMKQLRGQDFAGVFDPVVFRAFSDLVPPFPIGSLVGLTDGSQAVVLSHNPNDPCLPTVRRISDDERIDVNREDAGEQPDLDLASAPDLCIVSADNCDVEPFLFSYDEGIPQSDNVRAEAV